MSDLFSAIDESEKEWHDFYHAEMEKLRQARKEKDEKRQEEQLERLRKDLGNSKGGKLVLDGNKETVELSDDEEYEDEEDDE